jgi:hypothetical protein
MVSSNNKIVSSRFFEQSQFEQFTMSPFVPWLPAAIVGKLIVLQRDLNIQKV